MNFSALVRYNMKDYLQSIKIILPTMTFFLLQIAVYNTSPNTLIDSLLISFLYTFLIMIWLGYSYNGLEDQISQQLIILKTKNSTSYYLSQSVLLAILCLIISVACSLVPSIWNLSSHFERNVTGYDTGTFFILFLFSTLTGAFLGSLFHPCVLIDKKLVLALVLLIATLCLTKESNLANNHYLTYVLWILPPIGKYVNLFMESNRLDIQLLSLFSLLMVIYSIIYLVIRIVLLNRIKF